MVDPVDEISFIIDEFDCDSIPEDIQLNIVVP